VSFTKTSCDVLLGTYTVRYHNYRKQPFESHSKQPVQVVINQLNIYHSVKSVKSLLNWSSYISSQ